MENQVMNVRKGAWTLEEDALLERCVLYMNEYVPSSSDKFSGLRCCHKSCRLRWLNYLKPSIKRGAFQKDEVDVIIRLHKLLGNSRIPGKTTNDINNYWNSCLCKKVGCIGEDARKFNIRNTICLTMEKYNSYLLGQASVSPRLAHSPEAMVGCRHEIFRPQARTLSEGPICLPVIITCREFLPARRCFSSTDERPNSGQYLLAWTRLLPEDNEKDQRQWEKKDAISCPLEEELLHWAPQTDEEVEVGWWPLGWEDILLDVNLMSGYYPG
ncbi:unnamed protein product [Spirodela intermedia]|uniref:HTH myb-type domain-containing protein n=1 Tax=Spirodela intermedia TaxID=51605 RepID=A0A7I8KV09_SPIIN|nr:unnamed protein product [Spirodela intermedia]